MSRRQGLGVVIPARNAASTVAAAVASVRAQELPAEAILVVDDGSTDDTADVASRAGAQVLRHTQSRGAAAARDHGARQLDVDAVAFLDADDEMAPGFLESVVRTRHARPEAVLVFGAARELRDDGTMRDPPVFTDEELADPLWALAWHNRVPTSASVVPMRAYHDAGGFDPAFRGGAEDWDLWLRLALLGPFAWTGTRGTLRHVHTASFSRGTQQLDHMKEHGLWAVQRAVAKLGDRAPWFGRVAAGHILREAARRSLAHGLPERARGEALQSLRCNPADIEAWWVLGGTALPGALREALLEVRATLNR